MEGRPLQIYEGRKWKYTSFLVWFPPESELQAKIKVQEVYLGGDGSEEIRQERRQLLKGASSSHCGQLEVTPTKEILEAGRE